MTNQLTEKEIALLTKCVEKHAPEYALKIAAIEQLTYDEINDLRSAIGTEIAVEGLLPNDEPNEYGYELEDLIDQLADLYLWPKEKKR